MEGTEGHDEQWEAGEPSAPEDALSAPEDAPPAPSEGRSAELIVASERIAEIVRAAEDGANQLRADAERRAEERIAEADRAADYRVQAAEEEARDILADAQRQAEELRASAASESERAREIAEEGAREFEAAARREAERVRTDADTYAAEMRAAAESEARELTREARTVAKNVLIEGTELSRNLDEMSASLRTNSERLLRDIKNAHARLTADLDRTGHGDAGVDDAAYDVPEFVPRAGRGRG